MKVQVIIRASGRVIERGLLLRGDVKLIDVLRQITDLEEVIEDISFSRTLIAHEDTNIFANAELSTLIPDFESYDFPEQQFDEAVYQVTDKYDADRYDYKLMLGLFKNKASGL